MANYDASIRVSTKIDTSQMQKLQIQIDKAMQKVAGLSAKYEELKSKKIPTEEYTEISNQIEKAAAEFDKLISKQDEMIATGKDSGSAWDALQYKLEEAGNTIKYAKGELQDLVDSGKAFSFGGSQEDLSKAASDLSMAQAELRALNTKQEELYEKQIKTEAGVKKVTDRFKKLGKEGGKSLDNVNRKAKKTGGMISTLASRFKGIALSLLIFNWITKAFNTMVAGMKEGFNNLVKYSHGYNKTMSMLKSANTQLKNSFATAFAPIVQTVIPHLVTLINYLTGAVNKVAQFTAALTGKSVWIKATTVQEDYAGALNGTAAAAKKAAGVLAGFDDLDVLNKNTSSSGGSGVNDMFEEVEIDNGIADAAKNVAAWMQLLKEAAQPAAEALERLWNEGFEKLSKFSGKALQDFYNNFLKPLGKWAFGTQNAGFTRLVQIINQDLCGIDWDTINRNLKEFWVAIEPYAEQFGEGLIDFFEELADLTVDIFLILFGEDGAITGLTNFLNGNDPQNARAWGEALGKLAVGIAAYKGLSAAANVIKSIASSLPTLGVVAFAISAFETSPVNVDKKQQKKFKEQTGIDFNPDAIPVPEDFETLEEYNAAIETYMKNMEALTSFTLNENASVAHQIADFLHIETDFDTNIELIKERWAEIIDAYKTMFDENWNWSNDFFAGIGDWFTNLWEDLCSGFNSFGDWWYENAPLKFVREWFENSVAPWFTVKRWSKLWDDVKKAMSGAWTAIQNWWDSSIGSWWKNSVAPWFTKEKWIEILQGIKEGFAEAFKNAINTTISMFNQFINYLNDKMNFKWDSFSVAGKEIVAAGSMQLFTIPNIPQLATGGITTRPTTALIGEAGREAILPLENNTDWMDVLAEKISPRSSTEACIIMDGKIVGKLMYPYLKSEQARIGTNFRLK